jgi:hypothetical protein
MSRGMIRTVVVQRSATSPRRFDPLLVLRNVGGDRRSKLLVHAICEDCQNVQVFDAIIFMENQDLMACNSAGPPLDHATAGLPERNPRPLPTLRFRGRGPFPDALVREWPRRAILKPIYPSGCQTLFLRAPRGVAG